MLDKIPSFEYVLYHRNIWKAFTHASIELFHLWWDYCKQTPTYNEIVSNIDDFKLISGLIVQIETCVKSIKIYEDSISARK